MRNRIDENSETFLIVFQDHKNQIYEFASKMLRDESAAGDVTQDVFLKLYKNRKNIRTIGNVKNWLFIITRNLCLNRIRDRRKEIPIHSIPDENLGYDNNPDENRVVLEKSLLSLETKYREALILKEYQGFSYKEMAEILKISVPAVRSLLFNARIRLRENFHKINNGRLLK